MLKFRVAQQKKVFYSIKTLKTMRMTTKKTSEANNHKILSYNLFGVYIC